MKFIKTREKFEIFSQKLQKKKDKKKKNRLQRKEVKKMKSNESQIEQLYFFKKLAASNRLDSLILEQQQPYPLPEYTVNQIYCSQYATAVRTIKQEGLSILDNERSYSNRLFKKSKPQTSSKHRLKSQAQNVSIIRYPLPLAFAYFQAYANEKQYDKAIIMLSDRLQRKNVTNSYVISYNLSRIYRQKHDSKRSIFYLQSALKEKPFLLQAVLDYSFLLSLNNRANQALQMLKRHLGYVGSVNTPISSSLTQNAQVQKMFLNLACQSKNVTQEKQIIKIFNNKSLTIQTCFNLGLYFKRINSYQKASKLFQQIIQTLDEAFQNKLKNDSSFLFQQKDQKIYFYSKINLYQIYEQLLVNFSKLKLNSQINKLKQNICFLLKSLTENQEQANKKYPIFNKKYSNFLRQKLSQVQKNLTIRIQFISEDKQNETLKSIRYLSNQKKIYNLTELKKIKSKPLLNMPHKASSSTKRLLHSSMTAQSQKDQTLIKQFNKKFQQRRLQNQKKLKFLLLKDKELDNFFNTLPKINFQQMKNDQNQPLAEEQNFKAFNQKMNSTNDKQQSFSQTNQKKSTFIPPQKNKALISKLKKQLQANNDLEKYEKEFQKKTLKYEQFFSGYNIDQAVGNIMGRLFNKQKQRKLSQKKENATVEKINCLQKKQSQNQKKAQEEPQNLKQIKESQKNQKSKEQKKSQQNQKQKSSPYEQRNLTRKGSRQITQTLSKKEKEQKGQSLKTSQKASQKASSKISQKASQKTSEKTLKRSASSSSKNFRIKVSNNSYDQPQQQKIENKKKQSIIQSIQKNEQNQQKLDELQAPQIKVNQIDYDQQSSNLQVSMKKSLSDCIVEDDKLLQQRNHLRKNTTSDRNSFIASSTSLLTTHNIFVEKQRNNIEDIFQAFNLGSNRNILVNQNAPTSRDQSKKTTRVQYNTSLNNFPIQGIEPETNLPSQFQQKYDRAAQLQTQGQYAQAFQIYTQLYKKFKSDDLKQMVLLGIAFNFQLQQQFEQAQKTYLKCSKYNNSEAFMKLGQLLIRQNRIEDGIQNLEKANCITRFNIEIQTKLVYAYSLKDETTQKALSLAQSILKRNPMSLEILIMTAKIFQKQQKISQALEVCLAIDSYKESEFIKHYIGTLYLSEGNIIEAFKYFKNALTLNSNHVPSLIQIGTILSEMKPKQAISILNRALEIQPTNRFALTRLAKIYESVEQDPDKAMEIYRKTLQTKSNYQAYMKIADCQSFNGCYLEALVNYRQALNLKKTHTAYRRIAEMHEQNKQYKKSVENYKLALQIIPKENKYFTQKKQIMIQMAKDLLSLQQYEPAIVTLEQILQTQESKEIYDMLGQGYFGKQQYTIALEFYQKANNLEPDNQDVQLLEKIALCFDRKEQYTASKKIYEKILFINPTNISCMNNYANILLILGDTNEAFYWYEVMLQNAPKNIEKRLKVADIYSAVGDWSKVQYHLLLCYKLQEHDIKVLQKLINLYKEKRQQKMVAKYQKKLALMKAHNKKKQS